MSDRPETRPGEDEGAQLNTEDTSAGDAAVEDHTVVVPNVDRTVVVPNVDRTVVVPNVDRTIVVPGRGRGEAVGDADQDAAVSGQGWVSGQGSVPGLRGAAVPEPEHELSPEMREQMFKAPLDPRRRAPASPFEVTEQERPRGGVRPAISVLYGPRPALGAGGVVSDRSKLAGGGENIGDPPPDPVTPLPAEVAEHERGALPSLERANRRFGWVAFGGGAAVCVTVVCGVWILVSLF